MALRAVCNCFKRGSTNNASDSKKHNKPLASAHRRLSNNGTTASRMKTKHLSNVAAFGSNVCGQLGFGIDEEDGGDRVLSPRFLPTFSDEDGGTELNIEEIACGSEHTLFRLNNGRIYCCGTDELGELGCEEKIAAKDRWRIRPITGIIGQLRFRQLACASHHNCALTVDGHLISWGAIVNESRGLPQRIPIRVNLTNVVQVACGSEHTLALTADGRLFAWGSNSNGELGIGAVTPSRSSPVHVSSLSGVPIGLLAAGGHRSMILSVSGATYAWGDNCHGQLGVGDTNDRYHPTQVKSLRTLGVVHISCGSWHTAVLTHTGALLTFGANMYGQLGQGHRRMESTLPTQCPELMGVKITRVVCGKYHTLVVSASGAMVGFGLSSDGQLGVVGDAAASAVHTVPTPVRICSRRRQRQSSPPMEDKSTTETEMKTTPPAEHVVCSVFCGDEHSFAIVQKGERVPGAMAELSQINSLSLPQIRRLIDAKYPEAVMNALKSALSSTACINASFLFSDSRRFNACRANSCVDVEAVKEAFGLLADSSDIQHVTNTMVDALENALTELRSSPADIEGLRLYTILPWCHVMGRETMDSHWRKLQGPFATALDALTPIASSVIMSWWSEFQPRHFNRIVRVLKQLLIYLLAGDKKMRTQSDLKQSVATVHSCVRVLARLHDVNAKREKIPLEMFYVDQLSEHVDITGDYLHWYQTASGQATASAASDANKPFFFVDYPFLFNAATKTTLLEFDANLQMRQQFQQANLQNVAAYLGAASPSLLSSPYLVLQVNREKLVADTIVQLLHTRSDSLKKPLKVQFAGEEADDAGGVKKEFFLLLFQELLDAKYGMFSENPESHLLWFSTIEPEHPGNFVLVGLLCGLAIYNGVLVDFHFPVALYKKLLARPVTLEDLKQLSPTEGRSLEELLEYDDEETFEDTFYLNFTVTESRLDQIETVPLLADGSGKSVTMENRQQYVDLYVSYRLSGASQVSFEAFNDGFHRYFNHHEFCVQFFKLP